MKSKVILFWFRRDLRLVDNVGLYHALHAGVPVLPIFIFDKNIVDRLEDRRDRRVDYIHQALASLNIQLMDWHSRLLTFYGDPLTIIQELLQTYDIQALYANRDYEPQARARDKGIHKALAAMGISFKAFKDQVIFEKDEIVKSDGRGYTVFSPYAKRWREALQPAHYAAVLPNWSNFLKMDYAPIPPLAAIGFEKTDVHYERPTVDLYLLAEYAEQRNFPAIVGTSHLGLALRFGTISIRHCVTLGLRFNDTWLSELIWREFFMQILYFYPQVEKQAFKKPYDNIRWLNREADFLKWCSGETGYPLVDAGMRELNATGFMHNRVRMVAASFLCKHLLIDWRWGEAYFAAKLNDFDLSANNGNWQWVAGSGCDAAPYFRIFNPILQAKTFDKDKIYVKKWIPELGTNAYPKPMVDHQMARARALEAYSLALSNKE